MQNCPTNPNTKGDFVATKNAYFFRTKCGKKPFENTT